MGESRTSKAFDVQKRMMILAGVWPIANPTIAYNFFGFIVSFLVQNLFIFPSLLLFYFSSVDVAQGSLIMFCNIASICYQLKLGVFCIKRKTFCQILKDLDQPLFIPSDKEHETYIEKAILVSKRIRSLMYLPSVFFSILLAVYPALDRKAKRPLPFPLPINMETVSFPAYVVIYCMEVLAGTGATMTNTSLDTLVCSLMILCSAQLKILGEKLQNILDERIAHAGDLKYYKKFDKIVNVRLRNCIDHHIAITRIVEKLEETFTYEYLAQFITGLLLICVAGFSFVVIPISNVMFATAASFFSIAVVEIAIYCIFGNEIIVQSSKVRDCCYSSKWDQCGVDICKSLIIMMEQTKRPLVLSAGKFADLSHESLIAILKSSFSYFVVIRKLYGGNPEH